MPSNLNTFNENLKGKRINLQIQCAGEAKYTEDLPSLPMEAFGAFVLSTVAVGQVVSIDATAALVSQ